MLKKSFKYLIFFLLMFVLSFIAFVFTVYLVLFFEVRDVCDKAVNEYKKECIDSLILVLESENKTIREKNDAIWTLGQIADKRAKPALEKLNTGRVPEREQLDKVISQYEIQKALNWIENGNFTSWMYFNYR